MHGKYKNGKGVPKMISKAMDLTFTKKAPQLIPESVAKPARESIRMTKK